MKKYKKEDYKMDDVFDNLLKEDIEIKELKDTVKEIEIEYEMTVATAQYENLKPKIKIKINDLSKLNDILFYMRTILRDEYISIKDIKSNGGKNGDK